MLIIEDEKSLQEAYETRLVKDGYEVEVASDGLEGLQKAESAKPDIIILDILLPKLNGLEFLKRLQPKTNLPDTKILAFSVMESAELIRSLVSLGVVKYMVKAKGDKEVAVLDDELNRLGVNKYLIKYQVTPTELSEEIKGVLA